MSYSKLFGSGLQPVRALANALLRQGAVTATRIPLATSRRQFNRRFIFRDAQAVVDYRIFDLERDPVKDKLAEKVLIPILGDQYGAVLMRQELQLVYREGGLVVRYHDHTLPVAPDPYAKILEPELERRLDDHKGPDVAGGVHPISPAALFERLPVALLVSCSI